MPHGRRRDQALPQGVLVARSDSKDLAGVKQFMTQLDLEPVAS